MTFQVDDAMAWQEHVTDPTATLYLRCERRVIEQDPTPGMTVAQHGVDVAVTGRPRHPDDLKEVKRTPTQDEVVELLAALRHFPEPGAVRSAGTHERRIGMVSSSPTSPFVRLRGLHRMAGEATTDQEFLGLVTAADTAELTAMFDALGESPRSMMHRLAEPEEWPETLLAQHTRRTAITLSEGAAVLRSSLTGSGRR